MKYLQKRLSSIEIERRLSETEKLLVDQIRTIPRVLFGGLLFGIQEATPVLKVNHLSNVTDREFYNWLYHYNQISPLKVIETFDDESTAAYFLPALLPHWSMIRGVSKTARMGKKMKTDHPHFACALGAFLDGLNPTDSYWANFKKMHAICCSGHIENTLLAAPYGREKLELISSFLTRKLCGYGFIPPHAEKDFEECFAYYAALSHEKLAWGTGAGENKLFKDLIARRVLPDINVHVESPHSYARSFSVNGKGICYDGNSYTFAAVARINAAAVLLASMQRKGDRYKG
ncbi:MAG: hypothetical protein LBU87_00210 [Lactobacillales bacterium]|jgi:hypothetical protein|nr:hypothetical protein [Lactobacillales bacterium]